MNVRVKGPDQEDLEWMGQALALGALSEGSTSPNPRVGCLVVREGALVGQGHHRAPGLPHAEALALAAAGRQAEGATLYVNLEPCPHHGRTPPCTDLLIRSGVKRVVAALQDPNPLVNGKGFEQLRRAGVEVRVGPLSRASYRLNRAFFHYHEYGRPLVTLKAAISLDGMLAARGGRSQWITGPAARRFAHRLRLRHDAILVGAGTLRADDPRLTVRLPGVAAARHRAVLAPTLDLDPRSRLFQAVGDGSPPPRIYVSTALGAERRGSFRGKATVVPVPERDGRLDLAQVLRDLAGCGVQSVLVEGGAQTFAGFLDSGLADRAALFIGARLLGARGGTPLLDRSSVDEPAQGWHLEQLEQLPLGHDLLLMGEFGPGRKEVA